MSTSRIALPAIFAGVVLSFIAATAFVHWHGGRVGVDSEIGQGATFWFEIPRTIESA